MPREIKSPSVRGVALAALNHWHETDEHAENIIQRLAARHNLAPRDRAFLNALVLGVLRNGSLLDHWIDELRSGKVDEETQMILRLGLCQVLILDVDPHAAVNETVNLTKRARGFVNAILRRADRERDSLLQATKELPLDARYSLPDFLIEKWKSAFGPDNTTNLAAWTNEPAVTFVRTNKLIDGAEEKIAALDGVTAVAGFDGFFQCESVPFEALDAGLCYAQDPSTSLAPRLLAPQPGESVLDACAAPGGKAAILAELMQNNGHLVCADSLEQRLEKMSGNLERLGVTIAEATLIDWKSSPNFDEKFDKILVDVPCSNTGVLRRRVDVRWRLDESVFAEMQALQLRITKNALTALKPGSTLVYSTCSIEREENEDLVKLLVDQSPGLTLEEERRTLPYEDSVDGSYCAKLRLSR
ncbi:MAG: transcription antitermination factor NusB [Verrucomicrobiota bacterium]